MRPDFSALRQPKTWLKLVGVLILLLMCISIISPPDNDQLQAEDLATAEIFKREIINKHLNRQWRHKTALSGSHDLAEEGNDVVIYNRVPKCASTSTRAVFNVLSKQNNVSVFSSKVYSKEALNITEQERLVQDVGEMAKRKGHLVFIRHFFFVNFTKFGARQPVYINVIRDPLDRHVSDYYYKRYALKRMFHMDEARRNRTYNECVLGDHSECVGDTNQGYFRVIPYFCGQDSRCRNAGQWAMERAKRTVASQYAMVATVERLTDALVVLERLMPRYFSGASSLYKAKERAFRSLARSHRKDPLLPEVVDKMKNLLKYDYEFYEFVKQRFHKQWTGLNTAGIAE